MSPIDFQWSQAIRERFTCAPMRQLCQIVAARAGEQAGGDADVDAGEGFSAVVFEGELAFEGVDCLDPLAAPAELPEPGRLVFAGGADQVCTQLAGDERLEVPAGETLVPDDHLSGPDQAVAAFEECLGDLALAEAGTRARPQMTGMPSAQRS
jgi:hypothetical protein